MYVCLFGYAPSHDIMTSGLFVIQHDREMKGQMAVLKNGALGSDPLSEAAVLVRSPCWGSIGIQTSAVNQNEAACES